MLGGGEEGWRRGSLIKRGEGSIVGTVHELASGLVNTEAFQQALTPQI